MATLSKANMVTGNTITAADVTQLVDAFTAGGGYSVSISGSVTGSATSASYATTAASADSTTSASFASTSSVAYGVQYTLSSTITNSTNPPATPFAVNSTTADLLVVNTGGSVGFLFGAGYEGQKVKFITPPTETDMQAPNISISSSGTLFGLFNRTTTGGSPNTLDQLSTLASMQSCEFYYIAGAWYFVGNLATP